MSVAIPMELMVSDSISSAKNYLHNLGFELSQDLSSAKRRDGFLYKMPKDFLVYLEENNIEGYLFLPNNFPFSYPEILIANYKQIVRGKPHINNSSYNAAWGKTCLLADSDQRFFSWEHILDITFERFSGLLDLWFNPERTAELENDFIKEFDRYFEKLNSSVISLIDDYPAQDCILKLGLTTTNNKYVLAETEQEISNFFKKAGWQLTCVSDILYIHIGKTIEAPYPFSRKIILDLICSIGKKDDLARYHCEDDKNHFKFMLSMPFGDSHYTDLIAIPKNNNIPLRLSKEAIINSILQPANDTVDVKLGKMQHIGPKKLFKRAGNATTELLSSKCPKIGIVGCGSLGASLAFHLAKSGIRALVLVDNDKLETNNVGRHILGMDYEGIAKATAVCQYLQKQLPYIDIEAIPGNGTEAMEQLQTCDLIVIATGSDGAMIQSMFSAFANVDSMPSTLLLWFEAFALCGHAVYIQRGKYPNLHMDDIYDNIKAFNISNDEALSKEAGCASEYNQYAHISAESLVTHMARFIVNILTKGCDNDVLSIFGDISGYESKLTDKYKDACSYQVKETTIDKCLS